MEHFLQIFTCCKCQNSSYLTYKPPSESIFVVRWFRKGITQRFEGGTVESLKLMMKDNLVWHCPLCKLEQEEEIILVFMIHLNVLSKAADHFILKCGGAVVRFSSGLIVGVQAPVLNCSALFILLTRFIIRKSFRLVYVNLLTLKCPLLSAAF